MENTLRNAAYDVLTNGESSGDSDWIISNEVYDTLKDAVDEFDRRISRWHGTV